MPSVSTTGRPRARAPHGEAHRVPARPIDEVRRHLAGRRRSSWPAPPALPIAAHLPRPRSPRPRAQRRHALAHVALAAQRVACRTRPARTRRASPRCSHPGVRQAASHWRRRCRRRTATDPDSPDPPCRACPGAPSAGSGECPCHGRPTAVQRGPHAQQAQQWHQAGQRVHQGLRFLFQGSSPGPYRQVPDTRRPLPTLPACPARTCPTLDFLLRRSMIRPWPATSPSPSESLLPRVLARLAEESGQGPIPGPRLGRRGGPADREAYFALHPARRHAGGHRGERRVGADVVARAGLAVERLNARLGAGTVTALSFRLG